MMKRVTVEVQWTIVKQMAVIGTLASRHSGREPGVNPVILMHSHELDHIWIGSAPLLVPLVALFLLLRLP